MSGDGLRDAIAAAIAGHTDRCSCCPTIYEPVKIADAVLPVVQARIDAARELHHAPTPEAYDAACKALWNHRERADKAEAERDAAVARAEAAEQAVQRVRAVVDEWGDADPDRPNHGLWLAIRRALDGAP